jgi:hypothetical protein
MHLQQGVRGGVRIEHMRMVGGHMGRARRPSRLRLAGTLAGLVGACWDVALSHSSMTGRSLTLSNGKLPELLYIHLILKTETILLSLIFCFPQYPRAPLLFL